jgi:hypothetical protein
MSKYLHSALGMAAALAVTACMPALTWREPLVMSEYPSDGYVDSNMVVVAQMRMALPEGWRFHRRKKEDPKTIRLWIQDTGGKAVTGAYLFSHFEFALSPTRTTEVYAKSAMKNFDQKEVHRTEIDGDEAYVVSGVKDEHNLQRLSALIYEGKSSISEITLLIDSGFSAKNPRLPYEIFNSYKLMPRQMSERRMKGSFSFKCNDGSMEWLDDSDGKWESHGFSVTGKLGADDYIIGIRQVSTTRFQDFLKMERFQKEEYNTEIHLAGAAYPARAIVRDSRDDKHVHAAYFFKHNGKDYLLSVFRAFPVYRETDANNVHREPEVVRVLDTNFYFDGAP